MTRAHAIAQNEPQRPFSLAYFDTLFGEKCTLVLHSGLGLLTLLGLTEQGMPELRAQEQFSSKEVKLLLPLLQAYPRYCPHERLYASFYAYPSTPTTEQVQRARTRLQEALHQKLLDHEMSVIRNVLSRVRFKLRSLGIEMLTLPEVGYLLEPPGNLMAKQKKDES